MKKMKVLFLSMLVLFIPALMTSCSDDEKDDSNSMFNELIGTWEYKAPVGIVTMSETYTFTKNSRYVYAVEGNSLEEGTFTISDSGVIELSPDLDYLAGSKLKLFSGYILDGEHKYYKIR
ncbi:MAG: hypothetical protein ACI30C_02810 [Muribaculaceae bacterium]